MIQEAKQFDNRLKKLGVEIKVDDLLKKDDDEKQGKAQVEAESSEDEAMRQIEEGFKVYDSLEEETMDYSKLGVTLIDEDEVRQYFPKNAKGVSFSSKHFNPIGDHHRAPNQRLEASIKKHIEFLNSLDLSGLLKHLDAYSSKNLKQTDIK